MSIDTDMATQLDCRCCGRTERFDADVSRNERSEGAEGAEGVEGTDWQYVGEHGIDADEGAYFSYFATCPACIARAADGAVREARNSGLVTCLHPDHGSHVPGSAAFDVCRETGYLPLSDGDYERVMETYHDARERCCPECGRARSLCETTVEFQGYSLDGRACACGWSGRRKDLSYRKPTDSQPSEEAETDG